MPPKELLTIAITFFALIGAMIPFSLLLRRLYLFHNEEWESLGKPAGFFFFPRKLQTPWNFRMHSGLTAAGKLSDKLLLLRCPRSIYEHSDLYRLALAYRAAAYVGIVSGIIWILERLT